MLRPRALAALVGLLALAALAGAPGQAAEGAVCDALGVSRLLQDDAGSDRDAADAPGDGEVPILEEAYQWAFLDPPAASGAADLDDWFVVEVPPGPRDVTYGIVANLLYNQVALPANVPYTYLPAPVYVLHGFLPDGTPLPVRTSLESNHTERGVDAPGTWRFHASVQPVAGAPLCTGAHADSLGLMPQLAQDYGLYFGCNPICLPSMPTEQTRIA